ncbi:MAG: hypothetical protein KGZ30_01455 [Anaplasmataceae bacterium]|nr:hypothetical protein [Anaplasmataceae bacterium]
MTSTKIFFLFLVVIAGGAISWMMYQGGFSLPKISGDDKYGQSTLSFRDIDLNLSFKYPANLHLGRSKKDDRAIVCVSTPPAPNYAGYDNCQIGSYKPLLWLYATSSPAIEIVRLDVQQRIDSYQVMVEGFLRQFFPGVVFQSYGAKDAIAGERGSQFLYRSDDLSLSRIAFFEKGNWAIILRNRDFENEFNYLLDNLNLDNGVVLVSGKIGEGDAKRFTTDLPPQPYFFDSLDNFVLLGSSQNLIRFNAESGEISPVFRSTSTYLYPFLAVFDFNDSDTVYLLESDRITKTNLKSGSREELYKGPIGLEPRAIFPVSEKEMVIEIGYGDAGCSSYGVVLLNLETKERNNLYRWGSCEGEATPLERPITITPRGESLILYKTIGGRVEIVEKELSSGEERMIGVAPGFPGSYESSNKAVGMINDREFRFFPASLKVLIYDFLANEVKQLTAEEEAILRVHYSITSFNDRGFVYRGAIPFFLDYRTEKKIAPLPFLSDKDFEVTRDYVVTWE